MLKITKLKNIFYDCLYPIFCLNCGRFISNENKHYLCSECFKTIPIYSSLFCPICSKRISIFKKCHHSDKQSYLDFLGCASDYENELIKNLIYEFKYNFVKEIKFTLGDLLINYWLKISLGFNINYSKFCVIPIPLNSKRYNWRGFNQSEELAKVFSNYFDLPLLDNILMRKKNTYPQAKLVKEERILNVKNAFQLKNDRAPFLIQNKNIILIDDVFTSGATLQEAAKVLKKNGAKRVIGLVIAK